MTGSDAAGSGAAGSAVALDALSPEAAAARLAPLFEGAPRFLGRLVAHRPFGSWDRVFATARAVAHAMPEGEQVELIDAHPRLGAAPASVSRASFREQGYDRAASATPNEDDPVRARLGELNAAYEARFGFRYCVFVAGRPLAALIPELEVALARPLADRDAERSRAIDVVIDIAAARHAAGVGTTGAAR